MSSEWRRLGDHCLKIGSGATPKGGKDAYLESGPFTLIRSQNIYNDGFKAAGLAFISADQAKKLDGVSVEAGDVLLNITGDSVARVCLAPPQYLPSRVNQHVAIIRPDPAAFDSRFLRYFLASPYQQDFMLGLAAAGATRNALTKGMIEDFKVPCPPIEEQKASTDILAAFDDRITLLRETNATLEAIAQALFKSWFVDFDPVHAKQQGRAPEGLDEATAALFPDSFEESKLGLVPRGWDYVSLKDVVTIFDSKRVPLAGQDRAKRPGPYPYYGAAAQMDSVDDYLFDGVFLLTGEDGSVADEHGYPITQYVWGKIWVNNHAHVLQGKDGISTEHLMLSLKRTNIQPFMTGAVQAKLSQSNMWRIMFLKPPREISESFGKVIEPLYTRLRHNSEQAQTLASLRDTLLPRLISGQLRLPEGEAMLEEA
jgi:type I restriction enzyme S subunit